MSYTYKSWTYAVILTCHKASTFMVELTVFVQALQEEIQTKDYLSKRSTASLQSLCIIQTPLVSPLAAKR